MVILNYCYYLHLKMLNLYKKAAKDLDIPIKVVEYAYKSYWKFIRDTIQNLPLKEDLSEEDFKKLKTNFNIVSLGKLSCTYDRYKRVKLKERYQNEHNKNKENKTYV